MVCANYSESSVEKRKIERGGDGSYGLRWLSEEQEPGSRCCCSQGCLLASASSLTCRHCDASLQKSPTVWKNISSSDTCNSVNRGWYLLRYTNTARITIPITRSGITMPSAMAVASGGRNKKEERGSLTFHNKPSADNNHNDNNENWNDNGCCYAGTS